MFSSHEADNIVHEQDQCIADRVRLKMKKRSKLLGTNLPTGPSTRFISPWKNLLVSSHPKDEEDELEEAMNQRDRDLDSNDYSNTSSQHDGKPEHFITKY